MITLKPGGKVWESSDAFLGDLYKRSGARRWLFKKVPRTANARLRDHWTAKSHEAKTWRTLVRCVCGLPHFGDVLGKVRVTIRMVRARLQDPDNRVASVKPLLDALTKAGWLFDDDGEHLELHVEEVKGKTAETVVTWERIP